VLKLGTVLARKKYWAGILARPTSSAEYSKLLSGDIYLKLTKVLDFKLNIMAIPMIFNSPFTK
jgi:hypothetical protein